MSIGTKFVTGVLSYAILLQANSFAVSNTEVIQNAYINYQTVVHSGIATPNDAAVELSKAVAEAGVTPEQIRDWVAENATSPQALEDFDKVLANVQSEFKGTEVNPDVLGQITGQALLSTDPDRMAYMGCTGVVGGLVVSIAATLALGITALTLTKGVARIQKQFENKRQNELTNLDNEKNKIIGRPAAIDNTIISYQNQKALAAAQNVADTQTIIMTDANSYYMVNGVSTKGSTIIANAAVRISENTKAILTYDSSIEKLQAERNLYSDPNYALGLIEQATVRTNLAINGLNAEEQRKIELVPQNKKNAGYLGIAAGVTGAVATYLLIDGNRLCK